MGFEGRVHALLADSSLKLIFAHGARLDAWAALISRSLGAQLPAYRVALEANAADELVHADELSRLAGAYTVSPEYATKVGGAALTLDPLWNATLSNLVETRSEYQFRLAARCETGARRATLLAIADDERRHTGLGRIILHELGATPADLTAAVSFMYAADAGLGVDTTYLDRLTRRAAVEIRGELWNL